MRFAKLKEFEISYSESNEGAEMSAKEWYYYQNSNQSGPHEFSEIVELINNHIISQDCYLFKTGWADWRLIGECIEELGLPSTSFDFNSDGNRKVQRAKRMTIDGKIIVHNNGKLSIGSGVNISSSGIFIETEEKLFEIGEQLKVTCKVRGFKKAFNTQAEVVRFSSENGDPKGYGLKFTALDQQVVHEINELIDKLNHDPNDQELRKKA